MWALSLLLLACAAEPQILGAPATKAELAAAVVPLRDAKEGRVVLRGTVGQVCDQGCWFYLFEPTSMVMVNLDLGAGLKMEKAAKGHAVLVRGTLEGEGSARTLTAETVVLD
jgi:hypothetical protein